MKLLCVCSFVFVAGCLSTDRARPAEETKGPRCIAQFCFDVESISMLTTEQELVGQYGKGYNENGKFAFYCYEVPEQNLFIRFRPYHGEQRQIVDVFLSDVPSCPAVKKPRISFQPLTTSEGLKLGDPTEKVIFLYGKARSIDKASAEERIGSGAPGSSPFGDTVLRYGSSNDDLFRSEVYLRGGRVSGILISVSP